jgi:signal peptidase I
MDEMENPRAVAMFEPGHVCVQLSDTRSAFELWKKAEKTIRIKTLGTSMSPMINPGDFVSIRIMDPERLKMGDIICFFDRGCVVVHRFVRKANRGGKWWCCQAGDAGSTWSWIPKERVLGKVETIHAPGSSLSMDGLPWRLINSLTGLGLSFWIPGGESSFPSSRQHRSFAGLAFGAWARFLGLVIRAARKI